MQSIRVSPPFQKKKNNKETNERISNKCSNEWLGVSRNWLPRIDDCTPCGEYFNPVIVLWMQFRVVSTENAIRVFFYFTCFLSTFFRWWNVCRGNNLYLSYFELFRSAVFCARVHFLNVAFKIRKLKCGVIWRKSKNNYTLAIRHVVIGCKSELLAQIINLHIRNSSYLVTKYVELCYWTVAKQWAYFVLT